MTTAATKNNNNTSEIILSKMYRHGGFRCGLVGLKCNEHVLEQLLSNSHLTALLASVRGGCLLREVGSYIQVKHDLRHKYDAELVRGSYTIFNMVGAKL